jgi:hypothetical protein
VQTSLVCSYRSPYGKDGQDGSIPPWSCGSARTREEGGDGGSSGMSSPFLRPIIHTLYTYQILIALSGHKGRPASDYVYVADHHDSMHRVVPDAY